MNNDNLIPISNRTTNEIREMTSKGGKKSGETRREKATFRKALQWLIDSDIKCEKGDIKKHFRKAGININGLNATQLATLGLWYGAVQGNSTNYKMLMELSGELQENFTTKEPIINVVITDNSELKKNFFEKEE